MNIFSKISFVFFSVLSLSALLVSTASTSSAAEEAFAPIDCYKAAMNDSAVLKRFKQFDASGLNTFSEENAVNLCAGGVATVSRIACYKAAMADVKVLTRLKSYDGSLTSAYAEGLAARLCGGMAAASAN